MVQLGVNVDLIAIHVPVIGTVSAPQCQYLSQLSHGGAVGQMLFLPCLLWHQSRLNYKQSTYFER